MLGGRAAGTGRCAPVPWWLMACSRVAGIVTVICGDNTRGGAQGKIQLVCSFVQTQLNRRGPPAKKGQPTMRLRTPGWSGPTLMGRLVVNSPVVASCSARLVTFQERTCTWWEGKRAGKEPPVSLPGAGPVCRSRGISAASACLGFAARLFSLPSELAGWPVQAGSGTPPTCSTAGSASSRME